VSTSGISLWLLLEAYLPAITTLFWDIGGVILTNGWDRESRRAAAQAFQLDWEDFQDRHDLSFPAFDSGQITLDQYLDRTLFYRPRTFTREEVTAFMFAQSREYPETRAVLSAAARTSKYFIASINNEPLELNNYRIEAFNLRKDFTAFFSSCYLHSRKPEETIFRIALEVSQRPPEKCIFIDDRALNLEVPRRLGMQVIHYHDARDLRSELRKHRVEV
jgi:putative hydrolase of the HAD superfamily